jgi:hypothetical protein
MTGRELEVRSEIWMFGCGDRDRPYEVRAETCTVYGDNDDDDDDLTTIEEILHTKLHKEGHVTEDPSPEHTVGGVGIFEESGPIDRT